MRKLSSEEIDFMTKCLKENRPLPDNYRYVIPFETKKEYELTCDGSSSVTHKNRWRQQRRLEPSSLR